MLRKRFVGKPEHVINFFFFVAEEVREIMAQMGFRTFAEMVGQMQMLDKRQVIEHWKAKGLDFSRLFLKPQAPAGVHIHNCEAQDPQDPYHPRPPPDRAGAARARPRHAGADRDRRSRTSTAPPAPCSGAIAKRYGHEGLPDGTIHVKFTGTAGQSFGAWLTRGVTFELEGDANDYVGKGSRADASSCAQPPTPASCRRNRSSSATPCSTARSRANAISAASPANVSRCAIPARSP